MVEGEGMKDHADSEWARGELVSRWLGEVLRLSGLERWGWEERYQWELLSVKLAGVGIYVGLCEGVRV